MNSLHLPHFLKNVDEYLQFDEMLSTQTRKNMAVIHHVNDTDSSLSCLSKQRHPESVGQPQHHISTINFNRLFCFAAGMSPPEKGKLMDGSPDVLTP